MTAKSSSESQSAPAWEWETIFPGGTGGSVFRDRETELFTRLTALGLLFDSKGVGEDQPLPAQADELFEEVLAATCEVLATERVVSLYLAGRCWEHTDDEVASAKYAQFQAHVAALAPLIDRLEQWAARLFLDGRLGNCPAAANHHHWLQRCAQEQEHRPVTSDRHADAARVATGRPAWQRLYEDMAGSLTVVLDGTAMTVNQAQQELNRTTASQRRRATTAMDDAWSGLTVPATACLNAIKGDDLRLVRAGRWSDPLARSLFEQNIEPTAFAAMQRAAETARSVLHDFATAKATALSLPRLSWADVAAPLPGEVPISWTEAVDLIMEGFTRYHPALVSHTATVLDRGWVHAAATKSKRPTALCLPLAAGASRLMVTFDGSLDSVLSLAHELGHSYHYLLLSSCTELQRRSPLTMLEVPSMLCEGLMGLSQGARIPDAAEGAVGTSRLHMLNAALIGPFQVMVSAHARFLFEQGVLERRACGPLTSEDLSELMSAAQNAAHLDSLDGSTVPRTMWISHPHLYTSTLHSWPYSFALLLTLSLSNRSGELQVDPGDLDAVLGRTGMASPAQLARELGVDLADECFWQRGVEVLRTRVDQFTAAVTTAGFGVGAP